MTNPSTTTTESGGRQNMFPAETRPYIDETVSYEGYPQNAEKVNGRWAMIGFVALIGAYITTGQVIPGIFQSLELNNRQVSFYLTETKLFNMTNPDSKVKTKTIEKEKLVAETLNGRFAMIGLIAAIGAYLTTGQIIPGFI